MPTATLLIVEDNLSQQFVYKQLCEKFDFGTVFCSTGEDAIEATKLVLYAAVIVDMRLPGMDGVELVSQLRRMELESDRRTPIIALTASMLPEVEQAFRTAGVDEFMTKPFVIDDFRKMLLRWVYQSRRPNLKLLSAPQDAFEFVAND
jgi:CheY-like chemotaxis protein